MSQPTKSLSKDNIEEKFNEHFKDQQSLFGKGVMFLPKFKSLPGVEFVPIGHPELDNALGGGIPKGRVIEIYGPESSGKTTLCLEAIVAFQKSSFKYVSFIDQEHALDPKYAEALGVDMDRMPISQPDVGEDALNLAENQVRSGVYSLIIVDSVDAIQPRSILEGEIGDSSMGVKARLMSHACRNLKGYCNKTGTTIIFTNQIRMKIGVVFGNPETTSGGNALKFYASQRLDIRKKDVIKCGEEKTGIKTLVKVVKNKVAPPLKEASVTINYGTGIDRETAQFDSLVEDGVIVKSGSWYSFNGERIGQGKDKAIAFYKENEGLFNANKKEKQ